MVIRSLISLLIFSGIGLSQQVLLTNPLSSIVNQSTLDIQISSSFGGSFVQALESDAGSITSGFIPLSQEEGTVELYVLLKPVTGSLSSILKNGKEVQVMNLAGRLIATIPATGNQARLEQELNRIQAQMIILQSGSGEQRVRMVYSPRR